MKKSCFLVLAVLFILTACSTEKSKTTELTIKPYDLTEKEKNLVMQTGIEQIKYFVLDGTIGKQFDIHKFIETYVNGELVSDDLFSSNTVQHEYNHSLLSFGYNTRDGLIEFIHGVESGHSSMQYKANVQASTMGSLLSEKVILKKDQPVYLFAWAGTNGKGMSSVSLDDHGKPSGSILEADKAYVFKIMLTSKKEVE